MYILIKSIGIYDKNFIPKSVKGHFSIAAIWLLLSSDYKFSFMISDFPGSWFSILENEFIE
eukprot:snap_masked-scaffold_24-processed-gene-3.31-mRNA-1 protein AED:1.00 eAED:1.00 QI:0/-1/0/0/-1/1/1/0/60